ncbi:hypothetical protein [Microbacterium sp. CFBP9034]|uniref:hypothetical protein n=1 Tax=Microbacterium sp. CFBP9034 TaxID=3096540 RepID=UPI002A6A67AF|nr:hypothetical protein [Microbacterium sp. CFBP9034]MDY0909398.1 hypothetical protein [Microbacterium sp. CFBP9034]
MFPSRHRLGAALVIALTAFLATACASQAPPAVQPDETIAGTPTAPPPESTATPTADAGAEEDPTCETLIGEDIVADFESIGWSAQAEKFYLGDLELEHGVQCVWADFEGPAGDHLQIFGWAPISEEDAAPAQAALVGEGWVREESAEGVYITEPKETTIAVDDEGYGMTYLFAAGWVKLADTKQGLLLIEWPKS